MSFSPRPRPHTVNLSFTDPDLTDNYQDITATHSQQSSTGRHPRGDTPLSRRSQGGGGTPSSSTSTSQTRYASLSNLDKLLDYLDDEDNNTHSTQRESSTPVSYNRTANLPPSTARRLDQSQDSPDSPSPRPGSVAAMRSGDRSLIQAQGGLSFREPSTTQRLQDELEADHRATAEEEERREQEERDPDGASVDSITRVAQAVTLLRSFLASYRSKSLTLSSDTLPQALDEFDTIISLGSSTAHTQPSPRVSNSSTSARKDRPPSRFVRSIPSPPPSEQQRPPTSAYEPLPYSSSTSFTRKQKYGGREPVEEEEERDEREFIREESVRPPTHSTTELAGYDPHDLNLQVSQLHLSSSCPPSPSHSKLTNERGYLGILLVDQRIEGSTRLHSVLAVGTEDDRTSRHEIEGSRGASRRRRCDRREQRREGEGWRQRWS